MALNIHTDREFERRLTWLSRRLGKTKTTLIKELVTERYQAHRSGFGFGALRSAQPHTARRMQRDLKQLDRDHDLD